MTINRLNSQILTPAIALAFTLSLASCTTDDSVTTPSESNDPIDPKNVFSEELADLNPQELIGLNIFQVHARTVPLDLRFTPSDDSIRNYRGVKFRVSNYNITDLLDPSFPKKDIYTKDPGDVIASCVIYREDDDAYDIAVGVADVSLYQANTMKKAREGVYLPLLEEKTKDLTSSGIGCQGWGPTVPLSKIDSPTDEATEPLLTQ